MKDLETIADRLEIEALRAEFTDARMTDDYERLLSLFTPDAALRIPPVVDFTNRDELRAGIERLAGLWEFFVQTVHPGVIQIDGDTATGRTYIHEFGRLHDGRSELNYSLYHDRYRRTPDGWKFTERVYEIRYRDTTPLPGSAPPSKTAAPTEDHVPIRTTPTEDHMPFTPTTTKDHLPTTPTTTG